jgi:hypothetical protein
MYKLMGYKYNKEGLEVSKFEQKFAQLGDLKKKLSIVLQNYENYAIYKGDQVVESNFKSN